MNILESSYVPNFSVIYGYRPYGRVVRVQTLKDYRPIARSFHIIKTMGRIIRKQLVDPITITGGYKNQYQRQSQSIDLMDLGLVEV